MSFSLAPLFRNISLFSVAGVALCRGAALVGGSASGLRAKFGSPRRCADR